MSVFAKGLVLASVTILGAATLSIPSQAEAQARLTGSSGLYAVGRIGGGVMPKQKIDLDDLSAAFPDEAEYEFGPVGEVGVGYQLGRLRFEQTVGYSSSDLDFGDEGDGAEGGVKQLNIVAAGYFDFPISDTFVPFIGGGVGASRVEGDLKTSAGGAEPVGYGGEEWGLLWHADAGVGVRLSPRATLDLSVRYTRTSGLKFESVNAALDANYEPDVEHIGGLIGLRYAF